MQKSPKGTVSVANRDGMLRLRWRFQGKPYTLTLGLHDSAFHRRIARGKADAIQADMALDRFDPTLRKYRTEGDRPSTVTTADLFRQWAGDRTPSKYQALASNLDRFGSITTTKSAEAFVGYLRSRQKPLTANQNLGLLRTFGTWAAKHHHWPANYFDAIAPAKGAQQAREGEPFSAQEIRLFLHTLARDRYYAHYHDVCLFLLHIGCRPGEAHSLRWHQIDLAARTVRIDATKTFTTHTVDLAPSVLAMLQARGPKVPTDLVFPGPRGARINTRTFRRRCWMATCRAAGIADRPPVFARHSVASHLIQSGATYPQVAAVLGHKSTRMVTQTYGRAIGRPTMPEF
jgi:integrase